MTRRECRRSWIVLSVAGLLAIVGWSVPGRAAGACEPLPVTCEEDPASTTTTSASTTTTERQSRSSRSDDPPPEDELLWLVNAERSDRGLPTVAPRDDVAAIAEGHSDDMRRAGRLGHNEEYFTDQNRDRLDARSLGENVARGPTIEEVHEALMDSRGHRAIILEPRFTVIGLGIVADDEQWWITQDFVEPR